MQNLFTISAADLFVVFFEEKKGFYQFVPNNDSREFLCYCEVEDQTVTFYELKYRSVNEHTRES